jgi:starch-binding outer membrane protein, SusD/RagB family
LLNNKESIKSVKKVTKENALWKDMISGNKRAFGDIKSKIFAAFPSLLLFVSCQNSLNLFPLPKPSAEKWYSNETQTWLTRYSGYLIVAVEEAKSFVDLNAFTHQHDYSNLFFHCTKNSKVLIFPILCSLELKQTLLLISDFITRNSYRFREANPNWDLFCTYLFTDGKTICKSSQYDPLNSFMNRGLRCTASLVAFGTPQFGIISDANLPTLQITRLRRNSKITNKDNRLSAQFGSFNGLIWKKRVVDSLLLNGRLIEKEDLVIRLLDVMLIYEEVKTEYNEIGESVLAAINALRARAIKVAVPATTFPTIITNVKAELRPEIRICRRMELASEDLRYIGIIPWEIIGKVLNRPIYGILNPADLKSKVLDKDFGFLAGIPTIDQEGIPDFMAMAAIGLKKNLVITTCNDLQYLWPIRFSEIQIKTNMKQKES